jgi:hypothetical protein
MAAHDPRLELPNPYATVLLVHYYDDTEELPAVSTGSVDYDGVWTWDNVVYRDEELRIDWWLDLPLVPPGPPR